MTTKWTLALLAAALLGCSDRSDDPLERREGMTQRQRDSVLAESRLPGAGAVGRALDAADAAAARAATADSLARAATTRPGQ